MSPAKVQALLNGPAAKAPPGVQSNFDNPTSLDTICKFVMALCLMISTLSVLIRSYTRKYLIRSFASEDYITILAYFAIIGFAVPATYCFTVGGARHMWDIRLKTFFDLLYWLNVSGILYGITVTLIKIAILLQYLRIFVPDRKANMPLFVAIYIVSCCILVFYFVDTIFMIIMCLPREKIWDLLMPEGRCFDSHAAYMATGIFNVVSDFTILVLPMIPIWKLQLPFKKKVMILAVFSTGFCAGVTSIVRTYYTSKSENGDISWNSIVMGLWIWGELTAGILICSLPVMPKFFQHFGPKVFATLKNGSVSGFILAKFRYTDIHSGYEINEISTRPLKKHSSDGDFLDQRNEPTVRTWIQKGDHSNSHGPDTSLQDITVEQSITMSNNLATKKEDERETC